MIWNWKVNFCLKDEIKAAPQDFISPEESSKTNVGGGRGATREMCNIMPIDYQNKSFYHIENEMVMVILDMNDLMKQCID